MIKNYTADFHARARRDILAKMKRVWKLHDDDVKMPVELRIKLEEHIDAWLESPVWQKRRDMSLWPDATPGRQTEANNLARHTMHEYAQAFCLRKPTMEALDKEAVKAPDNKRADAFYHKSENWHDLTNLYASHVTNEAQAKFTALAGGKAKGFGMHARLIGNTLEWCRANGMQDYAKLEPKRLEGELPVDTLERIQNYWREGAKQLGDKHRAHTSENKLHTERQAERTAKKAAESAIGL